MPQTRLIEFPSSTPEALLRGVCVLPEERVFGAALFVHGFERVGTTEKKFKMLADRLVEKHIASFRFDFSGCGLSDGLFDQTTVQQRVQDTRSALQLCLELTGQRRVMFIGHSLGACVLTELIKTGVPYDKLLFLAPAFNQQQLLRYWFVQMQAAQSGSTETITWKTYQQHLDESAFQKACADPHKKLKTHTLGAVYHEENKERVYGTEPLDQRRVLVVHGTADTIVPIESLPLSFRNFLEVKGGDHDLERPDDLAQWIDVATHWLTTA